ncbi:MAG: DUF3667 domain-containing protein [Bacteroidales bacterium]|nr:DUF3667 domain-containing protein [Bacteroidales bacterium]
MNFFRRTWKRIGLLYRKLWHSICHPREFRSYNLKDLEKSHTCKNCSHEYKGNYCPLCGQAASTSRLTPKNLLDSTLAVWDINDRSVLGTVIALLYRPGHFIRDYLNGHRAPYYAPIKLLFFLCVIFAIEVQFGIIMKESKGKTEISSPEIKKAAEAATKITEDDWNWANEDDEEVVDSSAVNKSESVSAKEGQSDSTESAPTLKVVEENSELNSLLDIQKQRNIMLLFVSYFGKFTDWCKNNKALFTILMNLSFAFAGWIIFGKGKNIGRLSFTEHFFVQIFISCQILALNIILRPFFTHATTFLTLVVLPILMMWDFKQLYEISWGKSLGKVILLGILNVIIIFISFIVINALLYYLFSLSLK